MNLHIANGFLVFIWFYGLNIVFGASDEEFGKFYSVLSVSFNFPI